MTAANILEERERRKARKEARKEEQRNKEARRDVLLTLLRSRFGSVPTLARERIEAASLDLLGLWLDQAQAATSVAEALAEKKKPRSAASLRKEQARCDECRDVLMQALRFRYGPVPTVDAKRVEVASRDLLGLWLAQAFTAKTLAEALDEG